MSADAVVVRDESLVLPTYVPAAPERHPMFLEKRVYQGSSGRVYPLPVIDRIAEKPRPVSWRAITLENRFVQIVILPELGGRVHRLLDKTNGYDALYHQPVIKPALVGLAGPWISGGIEFNWPQHHRPSTFMPAEVAIEHLPSGGVIVWLSEHDPMTRMKGMHGVCLEPDSAVLELRARVHNRTDDAQTFLWWANVATEVHEHYQSFFPPDVTMVADHAKRAVSTFPHCSDHYYGVDYGARARDGVPEADQPAKYRISPDTAAPDDLGWYANIPVPTSYMAMGSREDFFGGYDHRARAGLMHIADHHIAPGKKQWTWGNHEFGYAWDRNLTDAREDGSYPPYIEIMAGVFTDNQPDFAFLQPGETKTWTQCWYPFQSIGPAVQANAKAALSLRRADGQLHVGVAVTRPRPSLNVRMTNMGGEVVLEEEVEVEPGKPWLRAIADPGPVRVRIGHLLSFDESQTREPAPLETASEPPAPETITSADELYLTGLHLEQYRHATRDPLIYWREALRRDAGDCRCNLAVGRWHLRRGEFAMAETFLRRSVARLTRRNPNPADGEAHYQLGRCLVWLDKLAEAEDCFGKAQWNQAWAVPALLAMAELACRRSDWVLADERLAQVRRRDAEHLWARSLQVLVWRKLNRDTDAQELAAATVALDPLDGYARLLAGEDFRGDNRVRLDFAADLARAGFPGLALDLLKEADAQAQDGSLPLVHYTRAWLLDRIDEPRAAQPARRRARQVRVDGGFPAQLLDQVVLQAAVAADANDGRAHRLLGCWLYDRRRHEEAIGHWQRAVKADPEDVVAWRCLGMAAFNIRGDAKTARRAYNRAVKLTPDDARLIYERDQLWARCGEAPAKRLRALRAVLPLVTQRDDLSVVWVSLLNQAGRAQEALTFLASRRFQPWEGGEGGALGQYVRARLLLGQAALSAGDAAGARTQFEAARVIPENLGEARHLLANEADVRYWCGQAAAATGDLAAARTHWTAAARTTQDFQGMEVKPYSELTLYAALALRELGQKAPARELAQGLLAYAQELERTPAKIDYFATSLPTLLLFVDDLDARQRQHAQLLQAQAQWVLGRAAAARRLVDAVVAADPAMGAAVDFQRGFLAEA